MERSVSSQGILRAFARETGGRTEAILGMGGREFIMDQSVKTDAEHGVYGLSYTDFTISPSGKYVLFKGLGWEWTKGFVYDVSQKKIILALEDPGTFQLASGVEDALFACAANFMSGIMFGKVYSLPEGTVRFSFLDQERIKRLQQEYPLIKDILCNDQPGGRAVIFTGTFMKDWSEKNIRDESITVDPRNGTIIDVAEPTAPR